MNRIAGWDDYIESLANQGFFQQEKVGSVKHTQLMAQAAEMFRGTETFKAHQKTAEVPVHRILELLQREYDSSKVCCSAALLSDRQHL